VCNNTISDACILHTILFLVYINHQSVSDSGSSSKFIVESGNCFVTSYHTIFCSHVCVLCLCLNITKLVLDSAIVNCISQSKQLMGTPHKVTNYLPAMLPLFFVVSYA